MLNQPSVEPTECIVVSSALSVLVVDNNYQVLLCWNVIGVNTVEWILQPSLLLQLTVVSLDVFMPFMQWLECTVDPPLRSLTVRILMVVVRFRTKQALTFPQ